MVFLWILLFHWIADFCCQSHWQACNKSSNMEALFNHTAIYTGVMTLGVALWYAPGWNHPASWANQPLFATWVFSVIFFGVITFILHTVTDAITSRITSKLYAAEAFHDFFVVVGFDQLIPQVTLYVTLHFLKLI